MQQEFQRRAAPFTRTSTGGILGQSFTRAGKHLLAGTLQCANCGGGFGSLNSADRYGCQWHRGRGPAACGNVLVVPRAEMEAAVVEALRNHVLCPRNLDYIAEQALDYLEPKPVEPDTASLHRQIQQVERQLLVTAEQGGNLLALAARLRALKPQLHWRRPRGTPRPGHPSRAAAASDRRGAGATGRPGRRPEEARTALHVLLGGQRMQVTKDKCGWRVEAEFVVPASPQLRLLGTGVASTGSGGGALAVPNRTKGLCHGLPAGRMMSP